MFAHNLVRPAILAALLLPCAGALLAPGAAPRIGDEWSYSRLTRPAVPAVHDASWVRNPIDAYVLARLEAAGLQPNATAGDAVLIRRATYDLTGLPPSPEEVAAYVADTAADKYERLVDRLLASPQYGEAWGRHWLDLVRFAETDSFERDRLKPGAWRYRDWVVEALNADKPFAEFAREQLAGDEVEHPTFETMVATGYYRLGIWDDEPTDPLQAVYDDYDNVLDTTSRVFLGMSMGCARCHDHKKDPIPTRDYYRLLAFFEGLSPYKVGGGNAPAQSNYVRLLPTDLGHADFQKEMEAWRTARGAAVDEARNLAREALSRLGTTAREELSAESARGLVLHETFDEGEVADGQVGRAAAFGPRKPELRVARAVQDDFTLAVWFRTDKPGMGDPNALQWYLGSGLIDGEVEGVVDDFGLSLIGGHVAAGVGNPDTFVASGDGNADGRWHHTAFTRERHSGHLALYVDGVLVAQAEGGKQALTAPKSLTLGRIQIGRGVYRGDLDDPRVYDRVLSPREVLELYEGEGFGPGLDAVVEAKVGRPEAERYRAAVARVMQLAQPTQQKVEVLCAQELGSQIAPSFVHPRGNAHQNGDAVVCGFPDVLGGGDAAILAPQGAATSGRRLAFANWLLAPDHPRTWRVLANRLWQYHFGRGIVRSPNDFGKLGDEPTHPELLDWLASEIVARGGRLKDVHRLLMTSSTYRMASDWHEAAFEKDPRNDLFWRFERRRLTAEELRDSMLAVDGSLNLEKGGPGVYPPMPAEVLATSSRPDEAWGRSTPEQAARRSIYVHAKRSLLMPLLQTFDLADTDATCPVRFVTTLPTQALTMLNSEIVNATAERFAKRIASERGDLRSRLARGVELVTQRPATEHDLASLTRLHGDLVQEHRTPDDEALRLCCLAMLNLSEFVYLD
ncbi:MAG: DUF1553 domain-containing protein [Planctomycetota bacterium]